MAKLNMITVGGKYCIEASADPISSPIDAPIGSLALVSNAGVGTIYLKTGISIGAWTIIQAGVVDFTAIASNVAPSITNTYSLGTSVLNWTDLHLNGSVYKGSQKILDLATVQMYDGASVVAADFANRTLNDPNGASALDWSASGFIDVKTNIIKNLANPVGAQDAATLATVESATGYLDTLVVLKDGTHPVTGNLSFSATAKITNLVDPLDPQDAATKKYVDDAIAGMTFKQEVESATIALENISISAPGSTIGGYSPEEVHERILLKDQTDPTENGIWLWEGAAVPMVRALDFDVWSEVPGSIVYVTGGTNAGAKFVCTAAETGTVGVTPITWGVFSAASSLDGSGVAGYNAYWTATHTLASEQYVAAGRGGLATDASAFTGVLKSAAGIFSASSIVDVDISATASIALGKLAVLTASKALVSDGSGVISASAVTATEIGYISGVTSAIQTQLDGKWNFASSTGGLNPVAAAVYFGTGPGDFDIHFYRGNTEVMKFALVASYPQVQLNAASIAFLSNGSGLATITSAQALSITSVGQNLDMVGDYITHTPSTRFVIAAPVCEKRLKVGAVAKVGIVETVQDVVIADGDGSINIDYISIYGSGIMRKMKVEVLFKDTSGVSAIWEKMVHWDGSNNMCLQQDTFTSVYGTGNNLQVTAVWAGGYRFVISGMGGMTSKTCRVIITDVVYQ